MYENEQEIWKVIKEFPQYKVSNFGQIMSYKNPNKPIILKGQITKKGYRSVHLRDENGHSYSKQVHRLVLENFSPREDMQQLEVNHIDENKLNNNLTNLEWMTHLENMRYGTCSLRGHLNQQDQILCVETNMIYNSMKEASEQTGVNYGNISTACKNGNSAGGFHWKNLTKKRWN